MKYYIAYKPVLENTFYIYREQKNGVSYWDSGVIPRKDTPKYYYSVNECKKVIVKDYISDLEYSSSMQNSGIYKIFAENDYPVQTTRLKYFVDGKETIYRMLFKYQNISNEYKEMVFKKILESI